MKRLSRHLLVLLLVGALLVSCTPPDASGPVPKTKTADATAPAPAVKEGWQQKWEGLLAGARQEREILIYSNVSPQTRALLSEGFRTKYGINVDFLSLSRGSEVFARAATERRVGLYVADLFITGSTSLAIEMKSESLLGQLEPLLVLPEVLDTRSWNGGQLPFSDKDKRVFDLIGAIWGSYVINTDLIREGEITSYADVVKPLYKGKIVMSDPTTPGSANAFMTHLAHNLWSQDQAMDFLRQLMKQEPVITRDLRLQVEWVARGKNPLAIGPDSKETASFIEVGAPIGLAWPKEGAYTSSVGGSLGIPVRSPHPNTTAVFINWLLTKEGQTLFSKGFGLPSNRVDVPPGINPKLLPPADLKIFRATEDYLILQGKMLQTVRETMAAASK